MFNEYIVDSKALINNVKNIKTQLNNNVKFCAVVKANGYGIGLETISNIINDYVDIFAVACLKEAVALRNVNANCEILILGMVDVIDFEYCSKNNFTISITNYEQLAHIKDCNLKFHLQVNTGLNRFGFKSVASFNNALKFIDKHKLNLQGVYSHFATKANDIKFMNKQLIKFYQFKRLVKKENVIFHIANSFATISNKNMQFDMVRNGFLLYGGVGDSIGNNCILTIKSRLINVFEIRKGESVGYDRTFISNKKMKIGVVSLGYADGFDRRLSNNFYVLINGYKCNVIGNVCMDVFMVDLSECNCCMGDEVIILGKQGKQKITLNDYAKALNTSPYEVLLKFNYRRMNYIVN